MDNKLVELYSNIQNYRFAINYLNDINYIYSYIENFNRTDAQYCASFYLQKYYKILSQFGKITGGIRLIYDNNIYKTKTNQEIIMDLYFCIFGILCEAYIFIGFSKNVNDFVINYYNK